MTLPTPEKIRTLQRKLYTKAKREPKFRFYALYDKICRTDILLHAYEQVSANGGTHGIDGRTFRDIEENEGKHTFIQEIREQLENKSYRADAVRRDCIPKPNGEKRPLGIPSIRDRVVQMAAKIVVEPIFEADFCDHSYGFRPKRSAKDAADAVADALLSGYTDVIDADLSKYFDTIPHDKLMIVVAERISDGAVLALIKQWLKAPVVEEDKDGTRRNIGGGKNSKHGTPQGGVISPLLANLYLYLLDRVWDRNDLARAYRAKMVRYADDLVILCAKGTDIPMARLRNVLDKLELTLNEKKTKIVDAREEAFDFLGFSFRMRRGRKSGKRYPHVEPSGKSIQKIKDRLKELLGNQRTPVPIEYILWGVNNTLRGWSNYFHYRNSTAVMSKVKGYTEERLRKHLRRRHKLKSWAKGYRKFPTTVLTGTTSSTSCRPMLPGRARRNARMP